MSEKKKDRVQCDFGQYDDLWKNHKTTCKKIIRITKYYIVYIDIYNNIDWETTEEYDSSKLQENKGSYEKTLSMCSIAEHKPTYGLSKTSILSFKTIIGEAIVNCLENNCDGSIEILKQADEFRTDRVIEKSREWHLTYTTSIALIFIFLTLLFNTYFINFVSEILPYLNAGAWAVTGACLSIILRSGNLQHASYAGRQLHFIESGCRLVGGFISGQIVHLGVKSGILFSNLVTDDGSQYVISLLVLLAGASERFAPSIITKIEDSSLTIETIKES